MYIYNIIITQKNKAMNKLENKIKSLTTEMLIETFKGLESNLTKEADLVNDLVMNELENRLSESEFEAILEEVYAD